MNKIFTTRQIAELDQFTVENEPVLDIDLMERASLQVANWIVQQVLNERLLYFFVGPGNNGGDALAVARMMADFDYQCKLFILDFGKPLGGSPAINLERLQKQAKVEVTFISSSDQFPAIPDDALVVDGLFGSGLNRPLEGLAAELVTYLNRQAAEILSIDIPSSYNFV